MTFANAWAPRQFILTTETVPQPFDATSSLLFDAEAGDTVSEPVSVLTELSSGEVVELANAPTIEGDVITQVVVGAQLMPKYPYRLTVSFTANTDKVLTMALDIEVPF